MMNRRSFLAAAAAAAFAPATFVRAAEGRRRVVVVGAGLAGLSCAYELRKLGFEVVVLEKQGRAGASRSLLHSLVAARFRYSTSTYRESSKAAPATSW